MWPWIKLDIDSLLSDGLSPNRIAALSLLAAHSNDQQLVTLSYHYIANRLHVSKRSAFRLIDDLLTRGYLEKLNDAYTDRYAVFRIVKGVASGSRQPVRTKPEAGTYTDDPYQQTMIDTMTTTDPTTP